MLGYDGSYRSSFSSNPSRSVYTDIDGYALTNFRAGFRGGAKRGTCSAGSATRSTQDYFDLLATQSGNTGLVVGQPGDPRTYGVTLSRSF